MTERRRPGDSAQPPIRETIPLGSAAGVAVAASPSTLRPAGTPAPDPTKLSNAPTIAAAPAVRRDGAAPAVRLDGATAPTMAAAPAVRLDGGTAPTLAAVPAVRLDGATAPTLAAALPRAQGSTDHSASHRDRAMNHGAHEGSRSPYEGAHEGSRAMNQGTHEGSRAMNQGTHDGSLAMNQRTHEGSRAMNQGTHEGSRAMNQGTHDGSRAMNQGAYQTDVIIPPTPTAAGGPRTALAVQLGNAPTVATPPGGLLGTAPTMAVSSGAAVMPDGTLDLPAGDQVDAAATFAPGQMLGRFVVRSQLGEGGMGVVLAGHDVDLGRPVAIKLVKRELDHPAYRQRLLREAQAMARLEHPNVARVYEVGSERGRTFVAMELIDGVTLTMWLRVQRRPWREILAMFEQVGAGLSAVHRADLIHRDFKPDNVLVDRDGRARVVDFGLARIDHSSASNVSPELVVSLTRTGVMMGTPGYMAPEQQFGGNVDARADQYSFCVALREALLGGRPVDPSEAAWHGTPRSVRTAIARGLAYEPNGRFASMDELLAALRGAGARRSWIPIAAAATTVAVVGAVVAVLALREPQAASTSPSPPVAEAPPPSKSGPVVTSLPEIPDMTKDVRDTVNAEIRKKAAEQGAPPTPGSASAATVPGVATSAKPTAPPPAKRKPDVRPDDPSVPSQPEVRVDPMAGAGSTAPSQPSANRAGAPPGTPGGPPLTRAPRLPAAYVGDPGHLPLVRATIRDLGWDGLDTSVDASKAGELSGPELGITNVKLGMLERRRGRCDLAARHLKEATQQLNLHHGDEAVWRGRAHTNLAICALAGGAPAEDDVNAAWLHGNRDHVKLLQALAFYEKGETQTAQALFFACMQIGDPLVQAAIKTWLTGTGLKLP
jgi:serine/threonine-protein kinase